MASEEKLWEICMDIYRDMYEEAEPSADFDELVEKRKNDEIPEDFYTEYELDGERQEEIIKEHLKDRNLFKTEVNRIKMTVLLGVAPVQPADD